MLRLFVLLALLGCRRAPAPPEPSSAPPAAGPSAAAMSWYLQAVLAEERGDLAHAERAWAWVVREDRLNARAHADHARFLVRQRRWPEAEAAWVKALALDPTWWEPYAGLAALAGRRGDRDEELRLLDEAVARSADVTTLERTLERHEAVGDREGARATLAVWLARDGLSDDERRRRWFAAQRLDLADRALGDLRATVDPRLPASALMFVDEALNACDLAEALDWAREIGRASEATEHPLVGVALEVAQRAGDLPLIARLLGFDDGAGAGRASDARPVAWGRTALAIAGAPAPILLAEGWLSVGERDRGEALLARLDGDRALRGWARVTRALYAPEAGDRGLEPATLAPAGASRLAWVVGFARGQIPADRLASALGEPADVERIGRLLGVLVPEGSTSNIQESAGPALGGEPGPPGASAEEGAGPALGGEPGAPGGSAEEGAGPALGGEPGPRGGSAEESAGPALGGEPGLPAASAPGSLLLPPAAYAAWLDERAARRASGAAPSRSAVAAWAARSPSDPRAHVAMADVEPERAAEHLDRALAIDPCDADALAARAQLASGSERAAWQRRATRADPLRPR